MAAASNRGCNAKYLTSYGPRKRAAQGRSVCYCVLAYSPDNFYVIYENDMIQNLHFTQKMERLYMQEGHYIDPSELVIGMPVAARYMGGDLSWYRAKLVSFDPKKDDYNIEFVDYAHSQTNSLDQLRAIPANIAEYPPMALQCKLLGYDPTKVESPSVANATFCDLLFKKWSKGKCVVSFLSTDAPPYFVRLWNFDTCAELTPEFFGLPPAAASSEAASATTSPDDAADGKPSPSATVVAKNSNMADDPLNTSAVDRRFIIKTVDSVKNPLTSVEEPLRTVEKPLNSVEKPSKSAENPFRYVEKPSGSGFGDSTETGFSDPNVELLVDFGRPVDVVKSDSGRKASPLDDLMENFQSILPSAAAGDAATPQKSKKMLRWDAAVQTDSLPGDYVKNLLLNTDDTTESVKLVCPNLYEYLFSKT